MSLELFKDSTKITGLGLKDCCFNIFLPSLSGSHQSEKNLGSSLQYVDQQQSRPRQTAQVMNPLGSLGLWSRMSFAASQLENIPADSSAMLLRPTSNEREQARRSVSDL